uniref:Uncharacterized protein n=1 Tax=Trypanosoma congolense (strain IL3000) TaxID=1068625 RepID=G0UVZ2_TRYCI|nr:conserved hypothetical protein [Trypanosoma congolense IL3000]
MRVAQGPLPKASEAAGTRRTVVPSPEEVCLGDPSITADMQQSEVNSDGVADTRRGATQSVGKCRRSQFPEIKSGRNVKVRGANFKSFQETSTGKKATYRRKTQSKMPVVAFNTVKKTTYAKKLAESVSSQGGKKMSVEADRIDHCFAFVDKDKISEKNLTTGNRVPVVLGDEHYQSFSQTRRQGRREMGNEEEHDCAVSPPRKAEKGERYFSVSAPLLSSRVRAVFNGRVASSISSAAVDEASHHSTPAPAGLDLNAGIGSLSTFFLEQDVADRGDEDAFSYIFPAVHNGEWFNAPREFIEHCNSVSHELLCEDAPLFPLVAVEEGQQQRQNTQSAVTGSPSAVDKREKTTFTEQCGTSCGTQCSAVCVTKESDSKQLHGDQRAYYWWFMCVHVAAVEFAEKEWRSLILTPLLSAVDVPVAVKMQRVGELWCSCRVFQASVAAGVAKRIVLSPELRWNVLREAATHVAQVISNVHVRLLHHLDDVDTVCNSAEVVKKLMGAQIDSVVSYAEALDSATSASIAVILGCHGSASTTDPASSTASAVNDSTEHTLFSGAEARQLADMAVHIASSIVRAVKELSEGEPAMIVEWYRDSLPSPHSPLQQGAHYDMPHEDGEDEIMSLALWLYLHDAARAECVSDAKVER